MKPVIKIVHYYEDGTEEVFEREHDYESNLFHVVWAKSKQRNEEERKALQKHMEEIKQRLRKVDVSIFPEKLF
jgi:hypothetical protein